MKGDRHQLPIAIVSSSRPTMPLLVHRNRVMDQHIRKRQPPAQLIGLVPYGARFLRAGKYSGSLGSEMNTGTQLGTAGIRQTKDCLIIGKEFDGAPQNVAATQ